FPRHLLATTTHDTKRSGDVRARIAALAGSADDWAELVRRWPRLEDANESYLVYQTLVGAWPLEPERLEAYVQKALREGKRNTNWVEPNEEHERQVREFCRELYADAAWRGEFEPVEAGKDVVAFRRGPRWLVVVPLRPDGSKAIAAAERFHDLLPDLPVGLYGRG